jgi:hypothetical protein
LGDAVVEGAERCLQKPATVSGNDTNPDCERAIPIIAIELDAHIDADDITLREQYIRRGKSVHGGRVDGGADGGRKIPVALEGWSRPVGAYCPFSQRVEFASADVHLHSLLEFSLHGKDDLTAGLDALNLIRTAHSDQV